MFSSYIIWYLFLAGLGSGCFVVSAVYVLSDARKQSDSSQASLNQTQFGFLISPVAMALASLMLFIDLGVPEGVWQIIIMPFQSIISIGAWLVVLFTILSAAFALCGLFMKEIPSGFLWFCVIAGSLLALATMTYTGILLSDMVAIDFWYTWWIPALFIVSSVSTGMAAILCVDAVLDKAAGMLMSLWVAAAVFAIIEILVLAGFIIDRFNYSEAARMSCEMLLTGTYAGYFWFGVCLCGLVLPLVIHLLYSKIPLRILPLVASAGVLLGGFCLRYCIVGAALYTPLALGVFP